MTQFIVKMTLCHFAECRVNARDIDDALDAAWELLPPSYSIEELELDDVNIEAVCPEED